jgi:hypothetical protein
MISIKKIENNKKLRVALIVFFATVSVIQLYLMIVAPN